ncbi:MAG: SBBP repeat-containing protein [bacterium]
MKIKMLMLFLLGLVNFICFANFSLAGEQLLYSTYLGGTNDENAPSYSISYPDRDGIAIDTAGNIYVTGITASSDFPTTTGVIDTSYNGNSDIFVCKLNPILSGPASLIYSTFIGGSAEDGGHSIIVDHSGNAYITGYTSSSIDFPVTPGAFDTSYNGGPFDAFITKLDATGAILIYSTYIGGSAAMPFTGDDYGNSIAIDDLGHAFITGYTRSINFPTTSGAFDTVLNKTGSSASYSDAFVTKLSADGSSLDYSTYLGGDIIEEGYAIALDSAGNAYVAGRTSYTDFPITSNAFDTTFNGGTYDGFFTKLNTTGSALLYSTFLGGSNNDMSYGIAVDNIGNAYLTGYTSSTNFPTTVGAFSTKFGGYIDTFVSKINPDLSGMASLIYSTYLGGSVRELARDIKVDNVGNAILVGYSDSTDYPITPGAYQTVANSSTADFTDIVITKLNYTGSALVYSTYLGGTDSDYGYGIAIDNNNNAYITGVTYSTDLPTTTNAFDTSANGNRDAFVIKVQMTLPTITTVESLFWKNYLQE